MALTINGRFFERNGDSFFVNAVTYGPFPPDKKLDSATEFPRIAAAGFNAIRVYEPPTREDLDVALAHELVILATVPWHWDSLFTEDSATMAEAQKALIIFLEDLGKHPALGALLIANEIRPDLVRFMGPNLVRKELESLIRACQQHSPELPIGYANFPTTEYLEPRNADFTAFNVYLEDTLEYRDYLRRLHNIAGDRPLLLSEFGYNTHPSQKGLHSETDLESKQAEVLTWAYQTSRQEAVAGFTVYSWSDLWYNGGDEVKDWSFGLTRREGSEKPALTALSSAVARPETKALDPALFTIAICTRNGGHRLQENLPHFENLDDPNFEIVIIDDGSSDDTQSLVQEFIVGSALSCRLLTQEPSGLSLARNHAAREGKGEFIAYIDDDARPHRRWLEALRQAFAQNPRAVAAGGPNLAPIPTSRQNAVVTACSGNASHILFDDITAEHLPGCNFALRREPLLEMGGFDKTFHAAGDDVDVCWRLLDAGHELAFHPAACVFHDRRPTVRGFLRQQKGYGEAEALLYQKHPERFGSDGIRWQGFIYSGAPLTVDSGAVIYHGPMGNAPFQMLHLHHMPIRPLHRAFNSKLNRALVVFTEKTAAYLRRQTRKKFHGPSTKPRPATRSQASLEKQTRRDYHFNEPDPRSRALEALLKEGWKISSSEEEADLERGPLRLIFAQTPREHGHSLLHLRLLHPPIKTAQTLAEIEKIISGPTP